MSRSKGWETKLALWTSGVVFINSSLAWILCTSSSLMREETEEESELLLCIFYWFYWLSWRLFLACEVGIYTSPQTCLHIISLYSYSNTEPSVRNTITPWSFIILRYSMQTLNTITYWLLLGVVDLWWWKIWSSGGRGGWLGKLGKRCLQMGGRGLLLCTHSSCLWKRQ